MNKVAAIYLKKLCEDCYNKCVSYCDCCGQEHWFTDISKIQDVTGTKTLHFCIECTQKETHLRLCDCCGKRFVTVCNDDFIEMMETNSDFKKSDIVMINFNKELGKYLCDLCDKRIKLVEK